MSDNIVTPVSRFLTPELIGKLASASGLDPYMGQQATAAAVPAILSGLAELAGKPFGAQQLAKAVAQQPAGISGSIASNLTNGSAQMADKGSSVLASLLGGGALGTLASTIGKFLGVGDGPARSLMGLLTPVIMGVLGREQRAAGLDADGYRRSACATEGRNSRRHAARACRSSRHEWALPTRCCASVAGSAHLRGASRRAAGGWRRRGRAWEFVGGEVAHFVMPLHALAGYSGTA